MKTVNKILCLFLMFTMLFSTVALAVDKTEEFNQALLDETIRINREMGFEHISTETIEVHLKSDVTVRSEYEKLFPEIETKEIKQIAPTAYENGTLERQILLLTFAEKTEDDIWEIVESLKTNPNVYYAAPMFISPDAGVADAVVPGDVTGDGEVDNRDLIMIARYLVRLVDFNDKQLNVADVNEDGKVDNADLILLAKALVSIKNDDTPTLSEERKTEILQEFVQGLKHNEDDDTDYYEYVKIVGYLGQFSGCDVVNIGYTGGSAAVIPWIKVADFYFEYGNPVSGLYCFKDGEHLFLDKAYEAGWITEGDVAEIWSMGPRMRTVTRAERVDGVFVNKEVTFSCF